MSTAANTTRVDDMNTVPTQPKNHRLRMPTMMNCTSALWKKNATSIDGLPGLSE